MEADLCAIRDRRLSADSENPPCTSIAKITKSCISGRKAFLLSAIPYLSFAYLSAVALPSCVLCVVTRDVSCGGFVADLV